MKQLPSLSFKLVVGLLFLFLAWILFAWFLAGRLIVEKPLKKADAILILSGSSVYIERTQKAVQIYKQGVAPKILLTDDGRYAGWSQSEQRNPPFFELAKETLIAQGVPEENIEVLPTQVTGTIYEARLLAKKVKEENWKSVLIVTSPYHTRRSLWIFERVLAENNLDTEIGIVAPVLGYQTPPPFYWWLTPFGWESVAGEYVKTFYYWVRY